MERNFTPDVQNEENLSIQVGKELLSSDSCSSKVEVQQQDLWAEAGQQGFEYLAVLNKVLHDQTRENARPSRLSKPLGFDHLEMLEAELINQGILIRDRNRGYSMAQHAAHEANVWRWRAQRHGLDGVQLDFNVDLPRYILRRAEELMYILDENSLGSGLSGNLHRRDSWGYKFETQGNVMSEFQYLNRFAAYLLGVFDEANNGYQRGLNLVLKVLSNKAASATAQAEEKTNSLLITLPVGRRDFFALLKQHKSK